MSGRHRQGGPGITQRALAGTVPVLGAAGAMTGLVLSSGAAAPEPPDAGPTPGRAVDPAAAGSPPPPVRTEVPGRGDQAVSAVSAATDAVREQGALARARDQRSVTAVVERTRAEASRRDAVAQQRGRAEFEQFRDRQDFERGQERATSQSPDPGPSDPSAPQECDLSGLPHLGPFADSDEIVDRDCGVTDDQGRQRSQDGWIDDQLLSSDQDPLSRRPERG